MKGRILTSLLTVIVLTGLQAQNVPAVPKLVVGLTIDQLRTDYIEAFSALYGERGFKRLWKEGRIYLNAEYDFINVDELVEQISKAVTQTDVTGIINCCSGNPMTLAERVENFIKDHKLKIRLNYGVFPDRPYDSPIIFGDDKKIKQIMSLK